MYVVTMYRFGDKEKHSYVLGIFTSRYLAIYQSDVEMLARGGKYEAWVEYHEQNDVLTNDPEADWARNMSNEFFEDKEYAESIQQEVSFRYGTDQVSSLI